MKEFKLDDAAVALEMRRVFRRTDDLDDARHAAIEELSRQLTAAGAPPGDLETQLRAILARPAPVEPGQDMVEALAHVAWDAEAEADPSIGQHFGAWSNAPEKTKLVARAGIRAVLSALASTSVDGLLSTQIVEAMSRRVGTVEPQHIEAMKGTLDVLAPILAAKDARIAELEVQIGPCRECHITGLHKLDCSQRWKGEAVVAESTPPADEQLAEEARRYADADVGRVATVNLWMRLQDAYAAGARREGRR